MVDWHLKQIGKVKKLVKRVTHELTTNQNSCHFQVSSSLSLLNNNEPFLDQIVTCNKKWIVYNSWLSGWTEKMLQSTSQSQPCTKKRSWSLFGGLLPIWSTTAFWIPLKKLLHLRWRNHYIWEVCSANRWDAVKTAISAAGIGQQKGLNFPWQCLTTHCTTNASKVEWIGL